MRGVRAYVVPVPLLAIAGVGISAFLLANHYQVVSAAFCSIASWSDCDRVNASAWSEIAGVPVAALGLIGFSVIAALALELRLREVPRFRPWHLFAVALGGAAFGTYLTLVEVMVLGLFCLLCLASFLLGIAILAFAVLAILAERRELVRKAALGSSTQDPP